MNVSQKAAARGGKFWSRLCALPAFSFLLNGAGGVARVKDSCGNWVELSEVQQIVDDAESRITELEQYKAAYEEWSDKTEWVQETSCPQDLGKHRADILRERIEALEEVVKALQGIEAQGWLEDHYCMDTAGINAVRNARAVLAGKASGVRNP